MKIRLSMLGCLPMYKIDYALTNLKKKKKY